MTFDGTTEPWLSIIGLGEDGRNGLSPAALSLIQSAKLVVGGKRHLALIGDLAKNTMEWPTPLDAAIPDILEHRGQPVVVLASGDPFHYGVGVTLSRHLDNREFVSLPQPSAFSLAANRLAWGLQDTVLLALNTRRVEILLPHLHSSSRIIALSRDGTTPAKVAKLLTDNGFGASNFTVFMAMGGNDEKAWSGCADSVRDQNFDNLNTIAIEVVGDQEARQFQLSCGLPDDWFANDGQLTKREIRAITLSSLCPRPGQHLWDVGCGSGSVAIEWMLSHPSCRATGVERDPTRAARAAQNGLQLGTPRFNVVIGEASEQLASLPPPDAVFVGGGVKDTALIDLCWQALPPGGRLVANAVTLEAQAVLQEHYTNCGGDLVRLSVERAEPIGQMTGWRPAMPVMQWIGRKQ